MNDRVHAPHFSLKTREMCDRLIAAGSSQDPDIRAIVGWAEAIPGLDRRVLAAANSLGSGGGKIRRMDHAVVYLGAERVRDILQEMISAQ